MTRYLICLLTGGHYFALLDLMGYKHCLVCHYLRDQEYER